MFSVFDFLIFRLFLQIKGLAEVANKEEDDGGGGGGNNDRGNGAGGACDAGVTSASSPPVKRPKNSPVENNCNNSRDAIRDLRVTSDHLRDLRNSIPPEPRDLSREREVPRDIPNHFNMVGGNGYPGSRRPPSPSPQPHPSSTSHTNNSRSHLYPAALLTSRNSTKSPIPPLSSGTPSYPFPNNLVRSRSPHQSFDPSPGSSLLPPRTSPQSTANGPEPPKMVGQIG